jgi:hypothetical protein
MGPLDALHSRSYLVLAMAVAIKTAGGLPADCRERFILVWFGICSEVCGLALVLGRWFPPWSLGVRGPFFAGMPPGCHRDATGGEGAVGSGLSSAARGAIFAGKKGQRIGNAARLTRVG